jgi:polyvinyl alcohol dehydrogenase (cytochrome)
MVTDAERAAGASGSSIWSTPSYDPSRKLIYVTTGNNFSQPTNGTSDAIIAVDADSGQIRWVNQRYPNDEWNFRFPASPEHPDFDFGDSPQVYNLPGGRRVVGAGQKSGFYHVVDATTGATINQIQVEPGGSLGGLFADTAVANGVVYANGINWPNPGGSNPTAGDLVAIAGDGSHELWRFTTPFSPDMAGVAVANGVVYFTSTFSQQLFALDATSGTLLKALQIGNSDSGPAISGGQIYVGTGDALSAAFLGIVGPGSITALGL